MRKRYTEFTVLYTPLTPLKLPPTFSSLFEYRVCGVRDDERNEGENGNVEHDMPLLGPKI